MAGVHRSGRRPRSSLRDSPAITVSYGESLGEVRSDAAGSGRGSRPQALLIAAYDLVAAGMRPARGSLACARTHPRCAEEEGGPGSYNGGGFCARDHPCAAVACSDVLGIGRVSRWSGAPASETCVISRLVQLQQASRSDSGCCGGDTVR